MEKKYYVTMGLEIHAEVKTKTKMFCACKNDPEETKPNINVCPVCMAHPGALPVPNKEAIRQVIRVGLAIGANIADFSEFDRKNYFYPDIPKGYQISQLKYPIVSGGHLAGMDITRIHLEEDTGNNKHFEDTNGGYSLIDFNRAGVPLAELVTEPHTFDTAEEAALVASKFAREYQLLLQYVGAGEANMEKGEMRVEANVSVSPEKGKLSKAYVEVKNLNSFKTVEKAIKYEVARMIELWEEGREGEIVKETRGWDEAKQKTVSQRKKESSEDYRYFPDPDLPKMKLHEAFDLEKMKSELPELPEGKRARYRNDFGIKDEDIETYINDIELDKYFTEVVYNLLPDKKLIALASNFISNDLLGSGKSVVDFIEPKLLAETVIMVSKNELSSRAAKDIILQVAKGFLAGKTIREHAEENNLLQQNDEGALKEIVQKTIDANPEVVATYKGGKENAIMSLVGKIIKETGGAANPQIVIKLLKELIV